jgi:hypothetical protein
MANNNLPIAPFERERQKKARKPKQQPMLLCHFANGELQGLDKLQGGVSIDPATGLREYSSLSELIKIPEVRQIFEGITRQVEKTGKLPASINKLTKIEDKMTPFRETPIERSSTEIEKLEKLGRHPDTRLALIPYDLAEFFLQLIPTASINPHSGLLEFGWFHEIIRGVGTVVGAYFGGPIGAGLGRAAAGMITGQKPGDAAMAGAKMGGMAYLGGAALGGMGVGQGAAAGSKMGMMNGMLGANGAAAPGGGFAGLSGMLGMGSTAAGAAGAGTGSVAGTAASGAPSLAAGAAGKIGTGAMSAAPAAAAPAAAKAGFFSNLMNNPMLVQGGISALGMMGEQKQHKHEKEMYEAQKKAHDEESAKGAAYRDSMGLARPWTTIEAKPKTVNRDFFNQQNKSLSKHGVYTASPFLEDGATAHYRGGNVKSYNKGTLVKGPGKGQQDLIKTHVPEGSYIIDASSTSMFGDGSSDAGGKILKSFEEKLRRSIPKNKYVKIEEHVVSRSPQLPVWLSNDEYKFDPVTVSILGGGSNAKGSKMLKQMVNSLRSHKNSNGNRLPPKSKNPEFYMKGK